MSTRKSRQAKTKGQSTIVEVPPDFRMVIDPHVGSPFAPRTEALTRDAAPADVFAACAIQKFDPSTGAGDLSDTIADAQG
jgi:hypothetical protein